MSPHQNLAIRNAITATTPIIKADINNATPANPKYSMMSPHLIRFGQGFAPCMIVFSQMSGRIAFALILKE